MMSGDVTHQPSAFDRLAAYLLFALVSLFIVSVHSTHFHGRNYRQDEAWRVHLALVSDIPQTIDWAAGNIHPPLWQIGLDIWVSAFGDLESITRFFSTLWTLLTLAVTFRLGSDLFGYRVGLLGILILGSLTFFQFYMHETRPYAQLVLFTTLTQAAFLRWLHYPDAKHAVIFVLAGIATAYTHFFGLIFLAALLVCFVVLVRFQPGLYVRVVGLFAAIGLAFTGWLLPFLQSFLVVRPGGINYALEPEQINPGQILTFLEGQMMIRPSAIGRFLLLLGLMTPFMITTSHPIASRFRFSQHWRQLYILSLPVVLLVIAFTANSIVSSLTPRNLLIILPSLALIAAIGLRLLPWRAQIILLALIMLPFVTNFRSYVANGPYQEIVDFITVDYQTGDPVIIDAAFMWQHIAITYYVRERMNVPVSNTEMLHLLPITNLADLQRMPDPPVHVFSDNDSEQLRRAQNLLEDQQQVWHIQIEDGRAYTRAYQDLLQADFIAVSEAHWGIEDRNYPPHRVTQYRRIPADLQTRFTFGEDIHLQKWLLLDEVNIRACQTITVESWWQITAPAQENYSLTLVLADSNNIGIARNDSAPANQLMQQWQVSQPYLDKRQLTVPCEAEPGDYNLMVGLYNFETGDPLGDLTYLTTLTIPSG